MSQETRAALGVSAFFAALFFVVLALSWAVRSDAVTGAQSGEEAGDRALPVAVVEVRLADRFEIRERLAGRVVSRRRSELGFERSGRLARIEVDEGDRVEAGALLARLDTRELEARRRELEANVESTRARLELARVTAGRQRELSQAGSLSAQDLDEALANESALEAQLSADRAALEHTEVGLELSSLHAPYPAIIVRRLADEGSIASPGQPVLAVLEEEGQEIHLGVPPELAGGLEVGSRHRVESGGRVLSAVVRAIVPEIDPVTRTQTAILEIASGPEERPRLAVGSLAWVRLAREIEAPGAWIPLGALTEGRRGTWTAFAVVDGESGQTRIERRQVEIIQAESTRAFVRGTLRKGDRIVRDGLHRLVPGLSVEIVEPAPVPAGSQELGSVAAPPASASSDPAPFVALRS